MGKIKNWILNTFFQSRAKDMGDISFEFANKAELYELVREILKADDHVIVGLETNNIGDEVLVVQWVWDDNIWFMLYSNKYRACNCHPRIMAKYMQTCDEIEYIYIEDINVVDVNMGNGSILMRHFLDYCKTTAAEYISGILSSVDEDHFDRIEHYYKKHGYTVRFSSDRQSGSIRYNLK